MNGEESVSAVVVSTPMQTISLGGAAYERGLLSGWGGNPGSEEGREGALLDIEVCGEGKWSCEKLRPLITHSKHNSSSRLPLHISLIISSTEITSAFYISFVLIHLWHASFFVPPSDQRFLCIRYLCIHWSRLKEHCCSPYSRVPETCGKGLGDNAAWGSKDIGVTLISHYRTCFLQTEL